MLTIVSVLMMFSHILITLACAAIGILLLVLKRRRSESNNLLQQWTYVATNAWFVAFIIFCGATHLTDLTMSYWPQSWLPVIPGLCAAGAGIGTAAMLWKALPVLSDAAKEMHDLIERSADLKNHTERVAFKALP